MTPEPLPPLCEAVINFEGQAPIPCNLPADHAGHCEFGSDESMRYQTAALDGLAGNGPAQAYTMGYEAGQRSTQAVIESLERAMADLRTASELDSTSAELDAISGYMPEQQARADAIAAATRLIATNHHLSNGVPIDRGDIGDWVIDLARQLATWIEHGDDEPKACAPIPCPPFEQTNLTVEHRLEIESDFTTGRSTPSCICGWLGETVATSDAAARLGFLHLTETDAPAAESAAFDRHVDEALDAAKTAQPRARPIQT